MATIGNTVQTLADWAKQIDPDGKTAPIVDILSQTNEMLDDMLWKEGNLPTGESATIRTGLPTTYWRQMNQGTPTSKATSAQIVEQCALLTARSHVDQDIAELNGNVAKYRMTEGESFLESMSQEMAGTLIYGSNANPEEFVGFANRFNDLGAANAQNIIDAGGSSTDNSSIYLVGWGERTVHGIFPKGSKAGLEHKDLGLDDVTDSNGDSFLAYKDLYKWKAGLVVKDWRYVVRIANVDISTLIADPTGATTNLIQFMIKALHRLPSRSGIKPTFYANRTIKEMLDIQAMEKGNLRLEEGSEEGKEKLTMRGVPIRTMDALTEAEARVV